MDLTTSQSEAADKIQAVRFRGIAYHKAGEGKTRISLELWRRSGFNYLIVVTRKAAMEDWQDEIKRCLPNVFVLQGEKVKEEHLRFKFVVLIGVDSIHKLSDWIPLGQSLVVLDELYLFSNSKSLRSKRAHRISVKALGSVGLSATIVPAQDNIALWGQTLAVGLSSVLAKTATQFREVYQINTFSAFSKHGQWSNKPGSIDLILQKLSPYIHLHYPKNEHRNIRQSILHTRLSSEQTKAIELLKETWCKGTKELEYIIEVAQEIQRIGNGYSEHEKGNLTCYKCPKLGRLLELIDELLAAGKSCVIWCAFRDDIEYLSLHITYPHLVFVGGTEFDSATWKEGNHKVVLATMANGASVNHFKHVEYGIYYSLNFKAVDLQQSQGRHERKGSLHAGAFYYYLLNREGLDQTIYDTVNASRNVEVTAIQTYLNNHNSTDTKLG